MYCDKDFIPNANNQIHCSNLCSWNYKYNHQKNNSYEKFTRVCPVCDKEFETIYYDKRYCNVKCKNRKNVKSILEKNKEKAAVKVIDKRFCMYCGKEFETTSHNKKFCTYECRFKMGTRNICNYCGKVYYGSSGRNYCSNECMNKSLERTVKCKICGKEFTSYKREKYCSAKCFAKRKSKRYNTTT